MKPEQTGAVLLSALWEARPRGCIVLGRGGKASSLPWAVFCARRDDAPVAAVLVLAAFAAPKAGRERGHPPAGGRELAGGLPGAHRPAPAPTCTHPRATALNGTSAAGCCFDSEHTRWVTANVGAAGEAGP